MSRVMWSCVCAAQGAAVALVDASLHVLIWRHREEKHNRSWTSIHLSYTKPITHSLLHDEKTVTGYNLTFLHIRVNGLNRFLLICNT